MKPTILLCLASSLLAQDWQPNVINARMETRRYEGNLASQIRGAAPMWFGYAVKAMAAKGDDNGPCCWSGAGGRGCYLEKEGRGAVTGERGSTGPIRLEGPEAVAVLFRVENNAIQKTRSFSVECPLDVGGLPFVWLTGVPAADSIRFLQRQVTGTDGDQRLDGPILAIAQHDSSEADSALRDLTRPDQPEKVREKAVFWLGASRGTRGTPVLKDLLAKDPSERVRDKVIFALSISKDPQALDLMINAAKKDVSSHVRGQALFWLAQKAGKQSVATIADAIANDPDTKVKEKAVFALSQLPKDEGVPKLIEVASNQKNPEVRKKAFFWLGQSRDPRALAFIEQVLLK